MKIGDSHKKSGFAVQITCWFVSQNQHGSGNERTSNCHTLLLSSGKLTRQMMAVLRQPQYL
jgi:hypothetical protein